MTSEQDIQKFKDLVKRIEDEVSRGVWNAQQQDEIEGSVRQAKTIFDQIINAYIDKPYVPPMQQAYLVSELQERLHRAEHSLPLPPPISQGEGGKTTDKNVKIYTTPTCPWCRRAKEHLSRKGIPYIEYNVAQDRDRAKEMIDKSGQMSVPVIIVNGEVIVGFNSSRLDSLLS